MKHLKIKVRYLLEFYVFFTAIYHYFCSLKFGVAVDIPGMKLILLVVIHIYYLLHFK